MKIRETYFWYILLWTTRPIVWVFRLPSIPLGVILSIPAYLIFIYFVALSKEDEWITDIATISHREMYLALKPQLSQKKIASEPDIVNLSSINVEMKPYDYRKDLDKIISSLKFQGITNEVERIYSLPKNTLMALIIIESGGNHLAKNTESTATGLFQILYKTGIRYGLTINKKKDERLNPLLSADCVGRMFAYSLSQNPSLEKAFEDFRGISGSEEWEKFKFYMKLLENENFRELLIGRFNELNENLIVNNEKPTQSERYNAYINAYTESFDNYGLHKYKTLSTLLWQGNPNYGALTIKEEQNILFLFFYFFQSLIKIPPRTRETITF